MKAFVLAILLLTANEAFADRQLGSDIIMNPENYGPRDGVGTSIWDGVGHKGTCQIEFHFWELGLDEKGQLIPTVWAGTFDDGGGSTEAFDLGDGIKKGDTLELPPYGVNGAFQVVLYFKPGTLVVNSFTRFLDGKPRFQCQLIRQK